MAEQSIAGPAGRVRASDGDRSARARIVILLLSVALALSIFLSLTSGASDASAVRVLRDWLTGGVPADTALAARHRLIVYDIRMPRVLLGVLIGAALAVSGAVMQGLFRNPLADPGLIGVSAGSSLGAVAIIVLGTTWLAPVTLALGTLALP
ncbi:MAG: iron ABC transporter, partial [Mesorhizobium sp.]